LNKLSRFSIYATLLLFSLLTGCVGIFGQKQKVYNISGFINPAYSGPITIYYLNDRNESIIYKDSVIKGSFKFKVKLNEPTAAVLKLPEPCRSEYMFLDTFNMIVRSELIIERTNNNLKYLKINKVSGSPSHLLYSDINALWKEMDTSSLLPIERSEKVFKKLDHLVKLHPDNNVVTHALFFSEVLTYKQANRIFEQLSEKQKSQSSINGTEKLLARLKVTDPGIEVVLNNLQNINGTEINSNSFGTKATLLDFWASWCAPCRSLHPKMLDLYRKLKSEGLEIFGVSLDTSKEKWLKASQDDGILWINTSDLKGYLGITASNLKLNYVPFNLLIDKYGKIVAKNVTIKDVENYFK
jgi:thiol-disulfide isomerase/thioredoxin